jgi:hypothetical protein
MESDNKELELGSTPEDFQVEACNIVRAGDLSSTRGKAGIRMWQ